MKLAVPEGGGSLFLAIRRLVGAGPTGARYDEIALYVVGPAHHGFVEAVA